MYSSVEEKPIAGAEGAVRADKMQDFIAAIYLLSGEDDRAVAGKRDIAALTGFSSTHVLRAVRESIERGYVVELRRGHGGPHCYVSEFRLLRNVDEIMRELEVERLREERGN